MASTVASQSVYLMNMNLAFACNKNLYFPREKFFVINTKPSILDSPIEYLKGVGPLRGDMLKKELGIFTFRDLLEHFPLRHVDKTVVSKISDITPATDYIQVAGTITGIEVIGARNAKRMIAELKDKTGYLELVWFQGITWVQKMLQEGRDYLVYGKVSFYNGRYQISHPEIELLSEATAE